MHPPKVYLDTTIFKFSATRLPRYFPREQTIDWGGRVQTTTVYDDGFLNPNDAITNNPELKAEAELLLSIASLAKNGRIHCVVQFETQFELCGLPKTDSTEGRFYGAPVRRVSAPFEYGRVVFAAGERPRDSQFQFLASLTDERFLELQRITGGYQGRGKVQRNQVLDAFHLWCAEHNGCNFFLSLDFKLQKVVARSKKKPQLSIVRPSELLAADALQTTERSPNTGIHWTGDFGG